MDNLHVILLISWLLYCTLHSILANEGVKVRIMATAGLSKSGYRLLYNVIAVLFLVALLIFQFSLASPELFDKSGRRTWISSIIIVLGLTGMIMCIIKYFRQLSGIRKIQGDSNPVLETTGMHKFVRHPLYISTFVFLTGLFLLMPLLSNLIAVAIIIVYTIIGIRFEEEKLIKEFGQQYIEYKRSVPMLIPWRTRTRERG